MTSYRKALASYYVYKIRKAGLGWTVRWLARRAAEEIAWVFLLPITVVLHLAGFRRVPITVFRLGHLASEVDAFLKEKSLGRLPDRRWFILAPAGGVANCCLLDYWREYVPVVTARWKCAILSAMSRHRLMAMDIGHYVYAFRGTASYYSIQAAWAGRSPLLALKAEHRERGRRALHRLGVPQDAWLVAVHVREPGFALADEAAHSHRNSSLETLLPAIEEIRRRGGWVIRMGDPSMGKAPDRDGLVDYAHHALRSDWMDVFICAECRFFLGNSSGLFILSSVFGVPCALANMVPPSHNGFAARDISIPKLIWSETRGRYLTFPEIFSTSVANFRLARQFEDGRLRVDENSGEDILQLVREMLDRLDGVWKAEPEDDLLQARYKGLLKPGHYAFGSQARIGTAFLRKHRFLLDGFERADVFAAASSKAIQNTG